MQAAANTRRAAKYAEANILWKERRGQMAHLIGKQAYKQSLLLVRTLQSCLLTVSFQLAGPMPEWLGSRSLKGRPDSFDLQMSKEEQHRFSFVQSRLKGSPQANAKFLWELRAMFRPGARDLDIPESSHWQELVINKRHTQRQKLATLAVSI